MARGEIHVEWSVDYADDPKMIAAGERAELLYIRATCLAKRLLTDGFVADNQLPRFSLSGVGKRAEKLVEVGLWERVEGGYRITAFLKRNKSRAEILADRDRDAERKRTRRPSGVPPDSERTPDGFQPPETESKTKTESGVAAEAAPTPKAKRATRIPIPYSLSEQDMAWLEKELPNVDAAWVERETRKFVDYWRGKSANATKLDWPATWRNWLRRASEGFS